jgi:hypothetical protein
MQAMDDTGRQVTGPFDNNQNVIQHLCPLRAKRNA